MFLPMACQHCEDAPCIKACPCGALHKEAGGTVAIDYNVCCGHGTCIDVCPHGALYLDPVAKQSVKCRDCYHRAEQGMQPACVPTGNIRRIAGEFARAAPACTTMCNRGRSAHLNGFYNDRAIQLLNAVVGRREQRRSRYMAAQHRQRLESKPRDADCSRTGERTTGIPRHGRQDCEGVMSMSHSKTWNRMLAPSHGDVRSGVYRLLARLWWWEVDRPLLDGMHRPGVGEPFRAAGGHVPEEDDAAPLEALSIVFSS